MKLSREAKRINAVLNRTKPYRFLKLDKPARSRDAGKPRIKEKSLKIEDRLIGNYRATTLIPPNFTAGPHLIYLHGGAYTLEVSPRHWKTAEKLAIKAPCRITLFQYPLAPEHSFEEGYQATETCWEELRQKYPEDRFSLMGDSAGGGLALGITIQWNQQKGRVMPERIILASPWLDLSLENPEIEGYEPRDMLLSAASLTKAANLWAGPALPPAGLKDPRLSPLYGNLEGLPPVLLIYSGDEIMTPDCRLLAARLRKAGIAVTERVLPELPHDWLVLNMPEADNALDEAAAFIRE